MKRRNFLMKTGIATGALTGLAGCTGQNSPPPRKSRVFNDVSVESGQLSVDLESTPEVETRVDGGNAGVINPSGLLATLSPVGVAAAKGRGATGRGTGGFKSAPKNRHGWAVWHGGDYEDDWREEHRDDLRMKSATVAALGIAYLGTTDNYNDNPPDAGPVPWDEKWENVDNGDEVEHTPSKNGWYRVGTHLVTPNGKHDFGWECVDLKISQTDDGYDIEKAWEVSPRV